MRRGGLGSAPSSTHWPPFAVGQESFHLIGLRSRLAGSLTPLEYLVKALPLPGKHRHTPQSIFTQCPGLVGPLKPIHGPLSPAVSPCSRDYLKTQLTWWHASPVEEVRESVLSSHGPCPLVSHSEQLWTPFVWEAVGQMRGCKAGHTQSSKKAVHGVVNIIVGEVGLSPILTSWWVRILFFVFLHNPLCLSFFMCTIRSIILGLSTSQNYHEDWMCSCINFLNIDH